MVRNASRVVAALLAVILGIGALSRIWGLDFGLPYTQARPDETYIIDVARASFPGRHLLPTMTTRGCIWG